MCVYPHTFLTQRASIFFSITLSMFLGKWLHTCVQFVEFHQTMHTGDVHFFFLSCFHFKSLRHKNHNVFKLLSTGREHKRQMKQRGKWLITRKSRRREHRCPLYHLLKLSIGLKLITYKRWRKDSERAGWFHAPGREDVMPGARAVRLLLGDLRQSASLCLSFLICTMGILRGSTPKGCSEKERR